MDFNKDQQEALKLIKDKNVLVSAGAGSGKTAVLTEKIYRLLKQGYNLDELLVVTFSNKAAYEMKSRVRDKLEKDKELSKYVTQLETSDITTFDAYYLKIVKKYGYLLGYREDVSIVDQCVFQVKQYEFIRQVMDGYYKKPTKAFKDLIYYYALRSDDSIVDIISKIIDEANKEVDSSRFYLDYENKFFNEDNLKALINIFYNNLKKMIEDARSMYLDLSNETFVNELEEVFYLPLLKDDYDALAASLLSYEGLPNINKAIYKPQEEEKETVKAVKDILKGVLDLVKLYGTSKDILNTEKILKPYHKVLIEIAKKADDILLEYKNHFGAYTFKDIASIAYKLVQIPSVNAELKNKIKFIMIDEYQDTNPTQEEFISLIANNNLFMVGDMKQSIYRFRDADPSIFQDKYNRYYDDKDGKLIIFKNNYRSREEVLFSVNDLFRKIMSEDVGGVNYRNGHELRYGNTYIYSDIAPNTYNNSFEIKLFDNKEKETTPVGEINAVLDDIISKIQSGYKIYDFADRKFRPVTFKDFAILVEKRTHYETYKQEFNKRQIPLKSDDSTDLKIFKSTIVIKSIIGLIVAIKNNESSLTKKHYYASIARSFAFECSDATIHNTIINNKVESSEIYKLANEIVPYVDYLSNEELLRMIINKFDLVAKLPKIGDILNNQTNIQQMITFAKATDKLEFTFEEMKKFFEELDQNEIDLSIESEEEVDDAVNILTIHKSKGLEYPICYFINLSSAKKASSSPLSTLISNKYGVHLKNIFDEHQSLYNYIYSKEERKEAISEQVRLFYVALTRTKEKPIAFISNRDYEKCQKSYKGIERASKIMDYLLYAGASQYVSPFERKDLILEDTKSESQKKQNLDLRKVNIESELIYPHKASKDLSLGVNKDALRYGTKLHELLEIVDFKTKDTKFIKSKKEREIIDRVINLKLFKDIEDALVYHEYEFEDELNNTVGVIDLLLIYKDHIDIVDFKLKDLDEEEYVTQLEIYEDFVRDNLNSELPINKYLLAILDGEVKKL